MEKKSNTNAKTVKKQNQASEQQQQNYNTEFASETDAQEVRKQNQQSQSKKTQQ